MQVLWPLEETPEDFIVLGSGSGLTIELKTNAERIDAFLEGQQIEASSVFMTTLKRLENEESTIGMPKGEKGMGYHGRISSAVLEKIIYLDLILPVISSPGPKKLLLVGWFGLDKIEKTVAISCDPTRLDQLAHSFIKEWWCKEGKSLRLHGNIIRWKSEIPELNPYIITAISFLSRWWSGTISFVEDKLNPEIIVKQTDKTLPLSLIDSSSHTISSGTVFAPNDITTWPEEAIVHCIAHEFGHCLGISVASGTHPPGDCFMGLELLHFRWHPYQRRAAYLVYTQPVGTQF